MVSPETVVLTTSVDSLLMVVLGGAGTLVGAAIGAAIVFGLREYLSTLVPWWQYVLGARLRAHHPLSADRPDGNSRARAAVAGKLKKKGKSTNAQGTGIRAFLTRRKARHKGRSDNDKKLCEIDWRRCCWQRLRSASASRPRPAPKNCASATSRR